MVNLDEYINTGLVLPENKDIKINKLFDKDTFSINDLCLVHTTDYFPFNHTISNSYDKKVIKETSSGKWYDLRKTVHFCLNGLVSDHNNGTFSGRRFAILEPIKNHMNEIYALRPEDTWTTSSVKLSDEAIILVDERVKNDLKSVDLLGYNIIYFSGNMEYAVNSVLTALNYKPQSIGMYSYNESDRIEELENGKKIYGNNSYFLKEFFKENYNNISTEQHAGSVYQNVERNFRQRDQILSFFDNNVRDTRNGYKLMNDEFLFLYNNYLKLYEKEDSKQTFERFCTWYGITYDSQTKEFSFVNMNDFINFFEMYKKKNNIKSQGFQDGQSYLKTQNEDMYNKAYERYKELGIEKEKEDKEERERQQKRELENKLSEFYVKYNKTKIKDIITNLESEKDFSAFIKLYGKNFNLKDTLYLEVNYDYINKKVCIIIDYDEKKDDYLPNFKEVCNRNNISMINEYEAKIELNNDITLEELIEDIRQKALYFTNEYIKLKQENFVFDGSSIGGGKHV